jgi:hypothetical protein
MWATIMFASLNEIKTTVERLLPPDVVAAMREAEVALTLVPQATLQPLVDISDELAERELAGDMVSYRKNKTGVDNVIFISPKGYTRHAARIKVAIEPPHSLDPTSKTASIEISSGEIVAGELSDTQLLKQVQKFIELNRPLLIEYWNNKIATDELTERLKPVE